MKEPKTGDKTSDHPENAALTKESAEGAPTEDTSSGHPESNAPAEGLPEENSLSTEPDQNTLNDNAVVAGPESIKPPEATPPEDTASAQAKKITPDPAVIFPQTNKKGGNDASNINSDGEMQNQNDFNRIENVDGSVKDHFSSSEERYDDKDTPGHPLEDRIQLYPSDKPEAVFSMKEPKTGDLTSDHPEDAALTKELAEGAPTEDTSSGHPGSNAPAEGLPEENSPSTEPDQNALNDNAAVAGPESIKPPEATPPEDTAFAEAKKITPDPAVIFPQTNKKGGIGASDANSDGEMQNQNDFKQIKDVDGSAKYHFSSAEERYDDKDTPGCTLEDRTQLYPSEGATAFLQNQFNGNDFQKLVQGKSVLVLGMGGGCDVFMAYTFAKKLYGLAEQKQGTGSILYANCISERTLSEDHETLIPDILHRVPPEQRKLQRDDNTYGTTFLEQSVPRGHRGSPFLIEVRGHKGITTQEEVISLTAVNTARFAQALEHLKADLVIGIDCGGDSLTGGKDFAVDAITGRDQQVLYALRTYQQKNPGFEFVHVVLAPGCDAETTEKQMIEEVGRDPSDHSGPLKTCAGRKYLGSFSIEDLIEDCFPLVQSLANNRTPFLMYRALKDSPQFNLERPKPEEEGYQGCRDVVKLGRHGNFSVIPRLWLLRGLVFKYNPEVFVS